jgi:hypothetical protein
MVSAPDRRFQLPQSESRSDVTAAKLAKLLSPAAVDALLAGAEASGTPNHGPDGLLAQMTKAVLERALDVEIADLSKAAHEVFPATREQRCWWHKQANVLAALPKSAHPGARDL